MANLQNSRNVKVDDGALQLHLHDFSKIMGRELGVVVKEQAGLFCEDMLKYSRPFDGKSPGNGLANGAKQHGMENVNNSILKIFRPIAYASGAEIANLGRYDVFKKYQDAKGGTARGNALKMRWVSFQNKFKNGSAPLTFIEKGDLSGMHKLHNSLRTDNGRGSLKSEARTSKEPFALVADDKTMKDYIIAKQKNVGLLKSPYWHAAKLIRERVKGGPWVQQPEAVADAIGVDNVKQEMKPEVTVGNKIGRKAGNSNFVQIALNYRAYAMRHKMIQEMRKQKIKLWQQAAAVTNTYRFFNK